MRKEKGGYILLNSYKHLDNGFTCIFIKSGRKKSAPLLEALIDTEDLELVDKATTEFWSMWKSGVTSNVNGNFIKMSRIITGISEDSHKIVIQANKNPLDLRRENLVVGTQGDASRASFQAKVNEIAKNLDPFFIETESHLIMKENDSDPTLNHSPSKFLYIEKNMNTDLITFTVNGKKRVLPSLNEHDTKELIAILQDLDVNIG